MHLFAGSTLPQLAQAVLQFAAQDGGRVGIERDEVPQRLAAVFGEPGERGGVGIGMARDIFTDRGVRMLGQAGQRLGSDFRVLADQAQQVEIGLGASRSSLSSISALESAFRTRPTFSSQEELM